MKKQTALNIVQEWKLVRPRLEKEIETLQEAVKDREVKLTFQEREIAEMGRLRQQIKDLQARLDQINNLSK